MGTCRTALAAAATSLVLLLASEASAADLVRFDKPGLVVLGCNIHDMMAAWVVIVDTPYFTKTAAGGTGLLQGLEPGDYKVNVWYPGPQFQPSTSQVHVTADGSNRLSVALDSSGSPLPELRARAVPGPGKARH
jgi:hypothetical protein